ncbi:hypothetical protein [Defluviimonas sp. SAOS-178_SWC]|uniref:hypothetical protein n=1 Tax=Defluviimonas sp. SAOS-178_SWC TaxID=3121287 RepID=UPI0032220B0E
MTVLTAAMKLVTGLLLLSVSVLNMDSAWSAVATRTFDAYGLSLIFRCIFPMVIGLWFLLPGFFDRSLERWSVGPQRLMLDLFLFGHGLWLASYWLYLAIVPDSFLSAVLPPTQILSLGIVWCLGYLAAFLFPGYAFRRFAPTPLPVPARNAAANVHALTVSIPPPVTRQVGWVRRMLTLLSTLPIILGLPGILFPLWFPTPETLELAGEWWTVALAATVLAIVIGTHGTELNLRTSRLRSQGAPKLFVVAVFLAFAAIGMTPFLTKTVPWAWSFAAGTAAMSAKVTVTHRGTLARRKGCDYVVTVAWPADPSRTATICEVPPDLWQTLQPGAQLRLSGVGNRWGMTYAEVARAE